MAGLADPTTLLWLAYVAVALGLLGLVLKAGKRGAGNFVLGALLVQQAYVTAGSVGLSFLGAFDVALTEDNVQSLSNVGAVDSVVALTVPAYLLWAPILFLLGPALLGAPRQYRVQWTLGVLGALPSIVLLVAWVTGLYSPLVTAFGLSALSGLATHVLLLAFAGTVFTMAVLAHEALTTPLSVRRGQFALLAVAFGIEGAYHAAEGTAKWAFGHSFYGWSEPTIWAGLQMAVPMAIVVGIAGYALIVFFSTADKEKRRWAGLLVITLAICAATGALAAPLGVSEGASDSRALFHPLLDLFALGLITYAGLRFQLFNLERQAKQTLAIGVPLVLAFLAFNVVQELMEGMLADTELLAGLPAAGVVAATVVSISAVPLTIVGKKTAQKLFPNVLGTPDYTRDRKYQIYVSALEGALVDGIQTPGEMSWLKRLRQELGIPDNEHARLEAEVRARLATAAPAPQPAATSAPGGSP